MKIYRLFFAATLFTVGSISFAQTVAKIAVADAKADLDTLMLTFEQVHYNPYFMHPKEEVLKTKNAALNSWSQDSIPLKDLMHDAMQLTALMSGGHSYMYWKAEGIIPEIMNHTYIPFTGRLNKDLKTFNVTRTTDERFAVGTEIKSINGLSVVDLYNECMSYIGGIETFSNATCEGTFPLNLFFNQTLKAPFIIETNSKVINSTGIDIQALADFLNAAQKSEDYTFRIAENNIGIIEYNSCNGLNAFEKFLKNTFKEIREKGIDKLIVDIRENGGGDSELNDRLLDYITKSSYQQSSGRYWKVSAQAKKAYNANKVYARMFGDEFMTEYMNTLNGEVIESPDQELIKPIMPKNYFEGKTCFLIGPNTFSSANFLADAVKTYKLSTLIGTATGEYTNDFGEQLNFTLPHSKCIVFISSTYDIGANGNKSELIPVYPDILVEEHTLEYALNWIFEN